MENKKVWIYSIAALSFLAVLWFVYYLGASKTNDSYKGEITRLNTDIKKRDIQLRMEAESRVRHEKNLTFLKREYTKLLKEDSLNNIKFEEDKKALTKRLTKLTSTELTNLMIKEYEKGTSIYISDSL